MRAQFVPCIIFSVDQASKHATDNFKSRHHAESYMRQHNIHYEKVLGVYQGHEEFSYIVTDMSKVKDVLDMAKLFHQDSVLLRDNENNCHLKFFDGRHPMYLGKLKQVPQEVAMANDAYTYSPSLKNYFMCVVD